MFKCGRFLGGSATTKKNGKNIIIIIIINVNIVKYHLKK